MKAAVQASSNEARWRKQLNPDVGRRDGILRPYVKGEIPPNYDIYWFQGVDENTLKLLREEKFLLVSDNQNYSPTIAEFLDFMDRHKGLFTAHGYAISFNREDYRISIEGLRARRHMTREETKSFVEFARHADEFELEGYCWWD